jgi:hypothetical protein
MMIIVVGFSPDKLTGVERGAGYSITAGFLSGRPTRGGPISLRLQLGTAGNSLISCAAK